MPATITPLAAEALRTAAAVADSMLYLTDAALDAGPDHESAAYLTALHALGAELQRALEPTAELVRTGISRR